MKINYLNGDATNPVGEDNRIIVHICNDIGGWGKGFVLAISKRWKSPEQSYRLWYKSGENFELGKVQFVKVENNLWIANLIGQHKIGKKLAGGKWEMIEPIIIDELISEGLNNYV